MPRAILDRGRIECMQSEFSCQVLGCVSMQVLGRHHVEVVASLGKSRFGAPKTMRETVGMVEENEGKAKANGTRKMQA